MDLDLDLDLDFTQSHNWICRFIRCVCVCVCSFQGSQQQEHFSHLNPIQRWLGAHHCHFHHFGCRALSCCGPMRNPFFVIPFKIGENERKQKQIVYI